MESNQPIETVESVKSVEPITITGTPINIICQSSTDRKPLVMLGFRGGYNNCLRFLHHSVKPIVGVVKYDFSDWPLFPTTVEQSKELAFKWSSSLEKKPEFSGKSVVIFFHLSLKTIRVEVKAKTGVIVETENQVIGVLATQVEQATNTRKYNGRLRKYVNPSIGYVPIYMLNQTNQVQGSELTVPQRPQRPQWQPRRTRFNKPSNDKVTQ